MPKVPQGGATYEMLFCILPLRVQGGAGSLVNPIAVF